MISGARRHDHITPVLAKLHWLPVRKRVMFKTVVLVWKCLNATAPGYLSELCVPVTTASGRQHLRSASTGLLQVPRVRTTIGRRSFAVAGPSPWNSLPAALRRPEMTLHTFKRQLKATICCPCNVLVNRRNIHHRPALLWRFHDSGRQTVNDWTVKSRQGFDLCN